MILIVSPGRLLRRFRIVTAMFVSGTMGCFPTLPPEADDTDAVADVSDSLENADDWHGAGDEESSDGVHLRDTDLDTGGEVGDLDSAIDATGDAGDTSSTAGDGEVTDTSGEQDVLVVEDVGPDDALSDVSGQDSLIEPECTESSDCAEPSGQCLGWSCQAGECVLGAVDEGLPCDDGDLCTDDDACVSGVCEGTARVCLPSSPCVTSAGCFSTTGTCIEVPVTSSMECDDGDRCTTVDMCNAGVCVGGPPPEPTDDRSLVLAVENSSLTVYHVFEDTAGELDILAGMSSSESQIAGSVELLVPAGSPVVFIHLPQDPVFASVWRWATPFESFSPGPFSASLGSARLSDGRRSFAGLFNGAFSPSGDSRLFGEAMEETSYSPDGIYVAQVAADRSTDWVATVHGIFEMGGMPAMEGRMNELGRDVWSPADGGGGLLAINMGTPKVFALRDGVGGVRVVDTSTRSVDTLTIVWSLAGDGVAREFGRLSSSSGRFAVRDMVITSDGGAVLVGTAAGAAVTFESEAGTLAIPTSSGDALYSWVIHVSPAGAPRWSRTFRIPQGTSGGESYDVHVGPIAADGGHVAVAVRTERNPVVSGTGMATMGVLDDLAPATQLSATWILATVGLDDGQVVEAILVNGDQVWLTGVGIDESGILLSGRATEISMSSDTLSILGDTPRPFVGRANEWVVWTGWAPVHDDPDGNYPDPGVIGNLMDWSPGLEMGGDGASTSWYPIWDSDFEVGPDRSATLPEVPSMGAAAIVRLNTNNSLDCR